MKRDTFKLTAVNCAIVVGVGVVILAISQMIGDLV